MLPLPTGAAVLPHMAQQLQLFGSLAAWGGQDAQSMMLLTHIAAQLFCVPPVLREALKVGVSKLQAEPTCMQAA